jgi:hypothetical protein
MSENTATPPMIYAAMAAVMTGIGAVGKTGTNKEQHYKFRSIEDVMSAVRAGLTKHGVFYLPTVTSRIPETRQTGGGKPMNVVHLEIRYDFYAADGSSVSSVVWGEGADMADKATNKAMSQALKYNLVQAFSIAAEDMQDADRSAQEAGPGGGYNSAAAAFENASPVKPAAASSTPSNGSPANGHVTRPPAQERPAPAGERDPDAQALADEAAVALTLDALKAIHDKATGDGKMAATAADPDTGTLEVLGVLIERKRKHLKGVADALAELHRAAEAQKMPMEDLEIAVKHTTGKSIDDATAAELRQAANALKAAA